MRIINTWQEVEVLSRAGVLPAPILEHVDGYFRQLEVVLQVDEEELFYLDRHGLPYKSLEKNPLTVSRSSFKNSPSSSRISSTTRILLTR